MILLLICAMMTSIAISFPFTMAMHTLYLKGSSLYDLRHHFYALAGYAVVMWAWAIKSYQKNS